MPSREVWQPLRERWNTLKKLDLLNPLQALSRCAGVLVCWCADALMPTSDLEAHFHIHPLGFRKVAPTPFLASTQLFSYLHAAIK